MCVVIDFLTLSDCDTSHNFGCTALLHVIVRRAASFRWVAVTPEAIRFAPNTFSLRLPPSSASTKFLRRPMGSCFSKPTVDGPSPLNTRHIASQEPPKLQQQSGTKPGREQVIDDEPSYGRRRTQSNPHKIPPMNDVELPPLPRQRIRAKSSVASPSSSSRNPNPDHGQTSAGECDHDRTRGASLTMTRAFEDCSRTNRNEFSPPPAAQL